MSNLLKCDGFILLDFFFPSCNALVYLLGSCLDITKSTIGPCIQAPFSRRQLCLFRFSRSFWHLTSALHLYFHKSSSKSSCKWHLPHFVLFYFFLNSLSSCKQCHNWSALELCMIAGFDLRIAHDQCEGYSFLRATRKWMNSGSEGDIKDVGSHVNYCISGLPGCEWWSLDYWRASQFTPHVE